MTTMPKRKPIRMKNYDYSTGGMYFITICTKDRNGILWDDVDVGAIINRPNSVYDTIPLSKYGSIVRDAIFNISNHYPLVTVDKYVIMPDHVHLLIFVANDDNEGGRLIIAPTISTVIQQFKGYVSKEIGYTIWQKSFYDRVIRSEKEYKESWQYIDENPLRWEIGEHLQ